MRAQNKVLSTAAFVAMVCTHFSCAAEALPQKTLDQIASLQEEKANRTPAQKKMDSQLIYAAKLKAGRPIANGITDLTPDLGYQPDGRVLVDIDAADVSPQLLNHIATLGGNVISSVPDLHAVRAILPITQVETIAGRLDVRFVRPADEGSTNPNPRADSPTVWGLIPGTDMMAHVAVRPARANALKAAPRAGSFDSQGDITHQAKAAREAFGVTGSGVKIGVMSDGVDSLTAAQTSGDLGTVTVLAGQASTGDEGTAMLQIVHDLAPGAQLFYATANGGAAIFAQNIRALRDAGCNIIIDDFTYFSESPFQDATISLAVNDVSATGVLYFSSARNSGNVADNTSGTWEGDFKAGGATAIGRGGTLHDFGGGTTFNAVTQIGGQNRADLFWADPLGGSSNDYDLYIVNSSGTVLKSSTNTQSGTQDPYEQVSTLNVGDRIVIVKFSGADRFLHLDTGRNVITTGTIGNVRGHNASGAANAFSVSATDVANSFPNPFTGGATNPVETFSSDGPRRIFFNPDGTPITPGNFSSTGGLVLQKPDITAADGVVTTSAVSGLNPFFGTSAAAPHAGAIAALIKSYNPALTNAQIRTAMMSTALDIQAPGFDVNSGAGIVMALPAVQAAPAPTGPVLEVASLSLSATGGNGNSLVDANECNQLTVTLKNTGAAAATGITATLSSSVPNVTIIQPTSDYPNLASGASGANFIPFHIVTSANFGAGIPVDLLLTVTVAGGPTFTLGVTPPSTPPFTVTGSLAAGDTTQTGRLNRNLPASTCSASKSCPGTFATTGARFFDAYTFTNSGSASACITVTLADTTQSDNAFCVAYLTSFNPASLCTNYLADTGVSDNLTTMSFSVAAGATFVVVVHEITPGAGVPTYTLTVAGVPPATANNGGPCSTTDLSITTNSNPVPSGCSVTFTATAKNNGPAAATNVVVSDVLPPGAAFVSTITPAGWLAITPPVGTAGAVSFTIPTLANGATADFTVIAVLDESAASGTFTNTFAVSSSESDSVPANNVASATATIPIPGTPVLNIADISAQAGVPIPLNISLAPGNPAVTQTLTLQISGVPANASLSAGTPNAGIYTLTSDQIPGLTVTAGDVGAFNLTLAASASINASCNAVTSTAMQNVTVLPGFLSTPAASPVIAPLLTSATQVSDLTVEFTAVVVPADTTVTWDFGDGSPTADGSPVQHLYAAAGVYSITVTAQNARASAPTTQLFSITVAAGKVLPGTSTLTKVKGSVKLAGAKSMASAGGSFATSVTKLKGGESLSVALGGLSENYMLDSKGKAKNSESSVTLKVTTSKKTGTTGSVTFKLTGNIADRLTAGVALDKNNLPKLMVVQATFAGKSYSSVVPVTFKKSKTGASVSFAVK
ncbi:MAG TPA: S8 family serine peptidase [Planctomycetota bacterium]|nr:S8 family serine peptidase [Planctomycetota bacterium]